MNTMFTQRPMPTVSTGLQNYTVGQNLQFTTPTTGSAFSATNNNRPFTMPASNIIRVMPGQSSVPMPTAPRPTMCHERGPTATPHPHPMVFAPGQGLPLRIMTPCHISAPSQPIQFRPPTTNVLGHSTINKLAPHTGHVINTPPPRLAHIVALPPDCPSGLSVGQEIMIGPPRLTPMATDHNQSRDTLNTIEAGTIQSTSKDYSFIEEWLESTQMNGADRFISEEDEIRRATESIADDSPFMTMYDSDVDGAVHHFQDIYNRDPMLPSFYEEMPKMIEFDHESTGYSDEGSPCPQNITEGEIPASSSTESISSMPQFEKFLKDLEPTLWEENLSPKNDNCGIKIKQEIIEQTEDMEKENHKSDDDI